MAKVDKHLGAPEPQIPDEAVQSANGGSIALVGHPNVGKSVLFQRLTGRYVTVSNYPGTTVQMARGAAESNPDTVVLDTPGVVTLPARSEDEQVTARVLLHEPLRVIVQVGDAKNLRRTLLLSVQLAEMGVPMVLALNMMDEADSRGVAIDEQMLSKHLSVPVVPTVATAGEGVDELVAVAQKPRAPSFRVTYAREIETALDEIGAVLPEAPVAARALALMWLSKDAVAEQWLAAYADQPLYAQLEARREELQSSLDESLSTVFQHTRLAYVDRIATAVLLKSGTGARGLVAALGHLATHPLWGLPVLGVALYGLYWFVGIFGAGTLVGLLEENLFGELVNPWVTAWVTRALPVPLLVDFLVGDIGLWTMGMTYALALILPIVTTFFLAFGVLEDSGYLPRLSVLTNRVFRLMGLNGQAVLPMVLGLGCVTMATLTTRVLQSRRDRLLVILLLALAVPCSAQLGVVLGMLGSISLAATMIWMAVVLGVLFAVGWLAARVLAGERSPLLVELPPLRFPLLSNVVIKTLARLEWYLKEVIPLFLLGTAIMFVLQQIGVLPWLIRAGEPLVVGWLGLPAEASSAFLLGFLRRDFGATGLFVMESQGLLSPLQVVVAMVTITLFVPCVASVFVIAKERSTRLAIGMTAVIFPAAFLVGGLLQRGLTSLGWLL